MESHGMPSSHSTKTAMGSEMHANETDNHTMTSMAPMEMMMTMVFNNDLPFHLLFSSVQIKYKTDLLMACVLMFFVGVAYEFLKSYRLKLLDPSCCGRTCCNCTAMKRKRSLNEKYLNKLEERCVACCDAETKKNSDAYVTDVDVIDDASHEDDDVSSPNSSTGSKIFHLVDTGLHGVQLVFSYVIMLAVMTYNVWVVFSVVMGCITGYLVCNWPRKVRNKNGKKRRAHILMQQTDCH